MQRIAKRMGSSLDDLKEKARASPPRLFLLYLNWGVVDVVGWGGDYITDAPVVLVVVVIHRAFKSFLYTRPILSCGTLLIMSLLPSHHQMCTHREEKKKKIVRDSAEAH